MANTLSAQKQARQNIKRYKVNTARKTSIKTAVKKVLDAIEEKKDSKVIMALLKDAEAQLQRAKNKGTLHASTVARKISRLAKKASATAKKS